MCRFAIGVSYLGTVYNGSQRLSAGPSIAAELEKALSEIADHPVQVSAAGRTDKGTHALQQVMHFDTSSHRQEYKWLAGTNIKLPQDIRLLWVKRVNDDFHARFCAHSRRYAYLIANGCEVDAVMHPLCYTRMNYLNSEVMAEACKEITGEYDCSSFTTVKAANQTSERYIDWIRIHAQAPWILIDIQANAFLHRMVRMLVAELVCIGEGVQAPNRLSKLFTATKPRKHKIAAPAQGLFLTSIGYSSAWSLPLVKTEELWLYRLVGAESRLQTECGESL